MKISKIFAGMSALAVAASMMAVSASAVEENDFVNATGEWTFTYTGDQIKQAVADGGAQLGENEDGTYTLGMNIQVGHCCNAKVTMVMKSTENNLFNGADADPINEAYLYTVQNSWNSSSPADKEKTQVKFTEDMMKGAVDLNGWDSGSVKFNGQWAQYILTNDNLDAITIEVTVVADADTTWEYHADDPDATDDDNTYVVFNMFGSPSTIAEKIPHAELNSQIDGGDTTGGDTTGGDDTTGGAGDTTGGDDTTGGAGDTTGGDDTTGGAGDTTGGDTTGGTSGSTGSSGSAGSTGSSGSTGSTGSSGSTGSTGAASDNTADNSNAQTGASAGIALAAIALAGAAAVASKKK